MYTLLAVSELQYLTWIFITVGSGDVEVDGKDIG